MRIPDEIIMEIKSKNPIEEVVSPYVNLKRAGRNLHGLCPFHNEKTPSFTVYTDTSSFYCFGCGAGGDVFTFIRKIENLDYTEAVKYLADKSGVVIPEGNYDDSYIKLKSRIYEINKEAAKFFHKYLFTEGGKWGLEYLTDRGLTLKTIKHFGIGVAPLSWDALLKHLKSKGFSFSDMEQANVITKGSKGYYDRFRNRIMFPIIEINGKVVGFSGRRHPNDDKGGKYINTSDTPVYKKSKTLFGFNFAKGHCSEKLLVVEGNMDVISLHQAGFENTVGTLGTAFTTEQAKSISRYTPEVVLSFDSDAAGQKAASRAMSVLSGSGLKVRVLAVPDGKDPDEYIKKNGGEKFKAVLEGAVNDIEFNLYKARDGLDITKNDGKLQYLNRAAKVLSQTNDSISVDLYSGKLAEKFGVSKEVLLRQIKDLKRKNVRNARKAEIDSVVHPKYKANDINPCKRQNIRAVSAEEEILSVLMLHGDLFAKLGDFSEEDFISPINKRIFKTMLNFKKQKEEFDISLLGDDFSADEMGYISSIQNRIVTFANPLKTLYDGIKVLREEKEKASVISPGDISDDEWTKHMQRMIEEKRSRQNEG